MNHAIWTNGVFDAPSAMNTTAEKKTQYKVHPFMGQAIHETKGGLGYDNVSVGCMTGPRQSPCYLWTRSSCSFVLMHAQRNRTHSRGLAMVKDSVQGQLKST